MTKENKIPRDEKKYLKIHGKLDLDKIYPIKNIMINKKTKIDKNEENNISKYERVDYDLDSMDKKFIDLFLIPFRKRDFELIMDRLEKEWMYFLIKAVKKREKNMNLDCVYCDVCGLVSSTENNLICTCSGCGVSVHQECYGVPLYNSKWYCKKCIFNGSKMPSCDFCTKIGGAYKQTSDNKWGHVICVNFSDDLYFLNRVFLEPICVDNIINKKSKKRCNICGSLFGLTIGCSFFGCSMRYHTTCGIDKLFYFDMKNKYSYCKKHDPRQKIKFWGIDDFYGINTMSYQKLDHKPVIRPNVPLTALKCAFVLKAMDLKVKCPVSIYKKIKDFDLKNVKINKKEEYLKKVCLWWVLKRNMIGPFNENFDLINYDEEFVCWMQERCK